MYRAHSFSYKNPCPALARPRKIATTQGPSNLNQKSILEDLSTFGDKYPQNATKKELLSSKRNHGITIEGPSVDGLLTTQRLTLKVLHSANQIYDSNVLLGADDIKYLKVLHGTFFAAAGYQLACFWFKSGTHICIPLRFSGGSLRIRLFFTPHGHPR